MTNPDSIFKSRDITLPTKVCLVKAMVFPVVMYGCESWTVKQAERRRIDAFELWCWRRLLRVPWTAGRFMWPHGLQYARLLCPPLSPRVFSNSCPLSQWCHLAISSSVIFFSSCPQFLSASESFPMSELFTWGGQSIRVSALASVPNVLWKDWC